MSARYTYVPSPQGMSHLMDAVNEFCVKYPEYRLLQVLKLDHPYKLIAILTTDPS